MKSQKSYKYKLQTGVTNDLLCLLQILSYLKKLIFLLLLSTIRLILTAVGLSAARLQKHDKHNLNISGETQVRFSAILKVILLCSH